MQKSVMNLTRHSRKVLNTSNTTGGWLNNPDMC
jgi:hypothetical protein